MSSLSMVRKLRYALAATVCAMFDCACVRCTANPQALKSVATRTLAESTLNLGESESKVVEVR